MFQGLLDLLPQVLVVVLTALGLVGLGLIVLMRLYWASAGARLGDFWPKIASELIQGLSGLASLGAAFAAVTHKGEWLPAASAGTFSLVVWKVLQVMVDNRLKAADKELKEELKRANLECTLRTYLLTTLREAAGRKIKRLRKQIEGRGDKPSIVQVRRALTPRPHLEELLEALAVFFRQQLPAEAGQTRNFRVGVYIESDGAMRPVHAISLNDPGYNPFKSFQAHEERFQVDAAPDRSHVVRCVREQRTLVVQDCPIAEMEGRFVFYNAEQKNYLKSMVAYNLGEVCDENGTMGKAALAVDTDFGGFFKETALESLEFCLREFATRLKLEMLLLALIAARGDQP